MVIESNGRTPLVELLVETDGSDDQLRAAGATVLARIGRIVAVRAPLTNVSEIAALPEVLRVEASLQLGRLNDLAAVETGAAAARTPGPGYTGANVVIGVIDSGIDVFHPDFRQPDGTTRIKAILDLSISGAGPGGGTVISESQINAELAAPTGLFPHFDSTGHGTHVAGSAAGDGSDSTGFGAFAGIAPEADLVVVKTSGGRTTAALVVTGLAFIDAQAAALGRPWVANLSFGTNLGPHDGTSILDEAVNSAVDPASTSGKAVVVAAGNEGAKAWHASTSLLPSSSIPAEIELSVPLGQTTVTVDIWYDGDSTFQMGWVSPFGPSVIYATNPYPLGETNSVCAPEAIGGRICGIVTHQTNVANGDKQMLLTFVSQDDDGNLRPLPAGVWKLHIDDLTLGSNRRVDLYTDEVCDGCRFLNAFDPSRLRSPATADEAITVGSYVTWSDTGATVGAISSFSSPGRTRDGDEKPDLVAPGEWIISSRAPGASGSGLYRLSQGTSMAAPMVTGAVALLLQADPSLDSGEIREVLITTAREDAFTGIAGWDADSGWGKLDVFAALQRLLVTDAETSTLEIDDSTVVADGVATARVTLTLRDAQRVPLLGRFAAVTESTRSATIVPVAGDLTGADGTVQYDISSTVPGVVTLIAGDDGAGILINDTVEVTFTTGESDVATLGNLSLSGVDLDPTFAPGTFSYTAGAPTELDETIISMATTDGGASTIVEVDNVPVDPKDPVPLDVGETVIEIIVTAENGIASENYVVTVTRAAPSPLLLRTPSSLDLGTSGTDDTFTIDNGGDGELAWSITDDSPWLETSPDAGTTTTETDVVGVGISRLGLDPGDYLGTITITSNGGIETIAVSMTVPEPAPVEPELLRSPGTLDFGTLSSSESFNIQNDGEGTLTWSVAADQPWLLLAPASGSTTTEIDSVTVTVSRDGLDAGDYVGTVSITSNGGFNTVDVFMTVPEAPPLDPVLSRSPATLDLGTLSTSDSFEIENTGEGTLTWSVSDNRPWLSASPDSGSTTTESDSVTVTVNRDGLDPGDYTGTVSITSNGGSSTVVVSMNVPEPPPVDPVLWRSPGLLDFGSSSTAGSFDIENLGEGTLTWSVSDNRPWLSVAPDSGSTTTESDSVTVTVNRDGLDPGDYTGAVSITSNGGSSTVVVSMNVPGSPPPPPPSPPAPVPSSLTITPSLTVVNDDGGSASADDFTVLLNGSAVEPGEAATGTSGSNQLTVDGPVSLYALTFSGDCNSSGAFTLPSFSALDCDIEADDLPLTQVLGAPLPGAQTLIDESLSAALDSFLVNGVRSVRASTAEATPLLTVTVPLSAVPGQSSVTVSVIEGNADAARFNPVAGTVFIAGMAYDIQILDAAGNPIEDFATPIELSFLLPAGVDPSSVAAYFWDEDAGAWRSEAGSVVDGRFVVSTLHLTIFALFEFGDGGGVLGSLPSSGVSLQAAEGGTVAQFGQALGSRGVTAVFVSHEGRLVGYVFNAPTFVNAEFLAVTGGVLAPGQGLLVVIGG